MANNEEYRVLVRRLEATFDDEVAIDFSNLPSGDELAAELERFLRGHQENP